MEDEMAEFKKTMNEGKGRFRSEYTMGEQDFFRLHRLKIGIDTMAARVWNGEYDYISNYFTLLKTLYINIWFFFYEQKDNAFNEKVKETDAMVERFKRLQMRNFERKPQKELLVNLEFLHKELLMMMQFFGLGIKVREEFDNKTLMKRALGIG